MFIITIPKFLSAGLMVISNLDCFSFFNMVFRSVIATLCILPLNMLGSCSLILLLVMFNVVFNFVYA